MFAHTGDVEIIISNPSGRKQNRYLLHRLILSQCSGFFQAGTRAEWSGRQSEDAGGRFGGGLTRISENESVTVGSSSRTSSQERRSSSDQVRRRWHYVLDWEGAGEDDLPMLVQKDAGPASIFGETDAPPPVRSKPPASSENFFRNITQLSNLHLHDRSSSSVSEPSAPPEPGDEVLKDYDNLFRTMYQYAPSLDNVNIASAYTECKALLHLADMYDALEIVGSRVDHHMLRFGARLFKQIAKYPPSYLKLAYLAKSRTMFAEAMVHVVGQWPLAAPQLRGQVESNVMELIEDKVDELRETEEKVESRLWRLNLSTRGGERVNPSNDFLGWLAVSLFRQWLAENTTPPPTGILKDHNRPGSSAAAPPRAGARSSSTSNHIASQRVAPPSAAPAPPTPPFSTGRVYRLLGAPEATYLPHDELKRFLKSPGAQHLGADGLYTRDNLRRFERRIDELRHLAREVVRPLMRNCLELDLRDFGPAGLGYLTCTKIGDREWPWDD